MCAGSSVKSSSTPSALYFHSMRSAPTITWPVDGAANRPRTGPCSSLRTSSRAEAAVFSDRRG